ncbi:hypothetical protein BGW38_010560 [Lunasporangiospora selenospora]|uniref:Kelch motif-containing protein n=1 Tax=Lunasporangiospora selenospora TaxID=979761 RepID=A0A9P6KFG1_9FUNG|nr:hypothetical protein BGW38_010560 [Lunasporangiospora selenospora]
MNYNSWAVSIRPSGDSKPGLFVYGQTICPDQVSSDLSVGKHSFTSSSASTIFELDGREAVTQREVGRDVLGPRLVHNDDPIPVQVVDQETGNVYTFVYDATHPGLGMNLYSFNANKPELDIAHTARSEAQKTAFQSDPNSHNLGFHNISSDGDNSDDDDDNKDSDSDSDDSSDSKKRQLGKRQERGRGRPGRPNLSNDTLAPFIDAGSAVYMNGTILIIGGGWSSSIPDPMASDSDPTSGFHKLDRCWIYIIANNTWMRKTLKTEEEAFPFPRRLAALVTVGKYIYMHGGNTSETISTDTYANDMWILDTEKWSWSSGAPSSSGRAAHTFVQFKDLLISVSGLTYQESPFKSIQNSPLLIYNTTSKKWTSDFGTPSEPFIKRNTFVVIIAVVIAVLLLLLTASLLSRLWKNRRKNRLSRVSFALGSTGVGPDKGRHITRFKPVSRPSWPANRRPSFSTTGSEVDENQDPLVDRRHRASEATVLDMSAIPPGMYHYKHEAEETTEETTQASQGVPLMNDDELRQQEEQRQEQRQEHVEQQSRIE